MDIQDRLEEVQTRFLALLDEILEDKLESKLAGENWTIKQELVHIVQVVEIIPAGIKRARQGKRRSPLALAPTALRGWVNGHIVIPRKAKNQTQEAIGMAYRAAHKILIRKLEALDEADWKKGIPYPRKYRTIEQMAYRPVEHFEEHEAHIRQILAMEEDR